MTPALYIAAIVAACAIGVSLIAYFAPDGWEDGDGFYLGRPCPGERDQQSARGGNTKFERPILPTGSVHHHHGSVSK